MTSKELHEQLIELGFIEGYIILDGIIIQWTNSNSIPASLSAYVRLDVNE